MLCLEILSVDWMLIGPARIAAGYCTIEIKQTGLKHGLFAVTYVGIYLLGLYKRMRMREHTSPKYSTRKHLVLRTYLYVWYGAVEVYTCVF